MQSDRRTILHLIAIGRLTPRDAERLIAAWNEGRELLLLLAAVVIFAAVSQLNSGALAAELVKFWSTCAAGTVSVLHAVGVNLSH
jgi:hypothetical protein